jgi:hypothetical protein
MLTALLLLTAALNRSDSMAVGELEEAGNMFLIVTLPLPHKMFQPQCVKTRSASLASIKVKGNSNNASTSLFLAYKRSAKKAYMYDERSFPDIQRLT